MANDTVVTIVGNLTEKPELTQVGNSQVCNFTVASTPSMFDRETNDWKDKETIFMRCSIWREYAQNLVSSLNRGDRVIVTGNLRSNSYEDKDGNNRVSLQLDVLEVGPSLRYATANVTKRTKGAGGNAAPAAAPAAAKDDTDGWGSDDSANDEPPF